MKLAKKLFAFLLVLSFTAISAGITRPAEMAAAVDTGSSFAYPFATGEDAFRNAPSFTTVSADEASDHWEFIQLNFDGGTVDLTGAKYIAAQIRVDQGDPGLTVGVLENNDRFNNSTDGNKFYFMSEDGTIKELSIQYSAVWLGSGACGMLLMPVSQMSWQWNNDGSDLTKVKSFYFTTNAMYNNGWKLTLGEVGFYDGEPGADGTAFTKLVDLSQGERPKTQYYVDSLNKYCMEMPSDKDAPLPETPQLKYPYREGERAYDNAATWTGTTSGDSADNWQTLRVKFDSDTVDLSSASYLVIQYYAKAGAPGITFGLQSGGARYSTCTDGNPVYFVNEGASASEKLGDVLYSSVNVSQGSRGAIIIPMASMAWQFGSDADKDLSGIDTLILTTNSRYNWNFEITIGEVGYCIGEPNTQGSSFTKILDLTSDKSDKFEATSDLEANRGTVTVNKPAREMLGDATLDVTGTGKTAASFGIWTGGSYGTVEMTTDTYGDAAMRLTATGSNPSGDAYTAIDMSATGGFSWGGMKGISFWARNDSDTEVSFNIEVDCNAPVTKNGVTDTLSDRFNIKQGNRYYLYDVNTGKTTVYMTRPTATLPVGFEGWVRIPFTAFERAAWSNNGVTKNEFMCEGSFVSYLAVTIHAANYMNKPFSVNKFGGYSQNPGFASAFVTGTPTIPELMGLSD